MSKYDEIINNKSYCPYPWMHSYLGSRYERKLCCISKDTPEEMFKTTQQEFWNSDYMKQIRLKMINGEEVSECVVCYKNERLGIPSLRLEQIDNYNAPDELLNDFLLSNTNSDNGEVSVLPIYYDYRTIECNLTCVSCGDTYSSAHALLNEKMHNRAPTFSPDRKFEEISVEEMVKGIIDKRITTIYWAGGEPIMSNLHWRVVETMLEYRQKTDYQEYIDSIDMFYNTNLTRAKWKGKLVSDLLTPLQPSIQASLDGTHETFEYTRDGAKWDEVETNFRDYYSKLNKKTNFGVATVLSAPVILDIERYLEFYSQFDVMLHPHYHFSEPFDANIMPALFNIRTFPEELFMPAIDSAIKLLKKYNMRNTEKAVSILKAYRGEHTLLIDNYNKEFYQQVKAQTLYRDKFMHSNRSLGDLYKLLNNDVSEWYDSIDAEEQYVQKFGHINVKNI